VSSLRENVRQIADLTRRVHMLIVVWGPGRSQEEHHEKRLKIVDEVKTAFPESEIYLGEDPTWRRAIPGSKNLSVPEQELWQLGACDACVVLDSSQGPGEEIAQMLQTRFGTKMLIFTHSKNRKSSGFPAYVRETGVQLFYTETEYASCRLVDKVVARLRQVALRKFAAL
jgi:hypothetical protein